MKKYLLLLLLIFLCCAVALGEECEVAEDVSGIAFFPSSGEAYEDGTANVLRIQYVGADGDEALYGDVEAAHAYAWDTLGEGLLTIYAPEKEAQLRFVYEGIAEDDVGDYEFVDYDSWYGGYVNGQIRRIYYHEDNRYALYIQFYFDSDDSGLYPHLGLRVEYLPESAEWSVTRFDSDKISDSYEAQLCAIFGYLDYCGGFEVQTNSSNLNVRVSPGGDVIGSLPKGSRLMIYRYQMLPAAGSNLSGVPFALVAKYTDPDENGVSYREYFGWCVTEYLVKEGDFLWVLNGQLADGTENFPEGTRIVEGFGADAY